MPLSPGVRLGPYEILAAIGAGGMGEVYRAKDTRLDRTVAIKILPAHLSSDRVRKQRFEREAKTISSLNHPHICVLYDVGQENGIDYLVMECVEGESLAQRLEKGALLPEQVLKYGMQIADALDKAHRQGIIHRDLKPGNIMLANSGTKLLDFGLARTSVQLSNGATLTAAVTDDASVTQQGTIVGTLRYMSPEQLEGKEVDGRSDIFSFGAVLYEMVTGQRAFPGKSQFSVASAILGKEPVAISTLQPMAPPALERAVKRCLAKEPDDRWQAARDLELELKWIADNSSQGHTLGVGTASANPASWRRELLWGVVALFLAAAAGLTAWSLKPSPGRPVSRLTITLPQDQQLVLLENGPAIALSPDGTRLAYVAIRRGTQQIYLRAMDSLDAKPISGTEGATDPFFSPDGQWLGFFAGQKLKKISVSGGAAITLSEVALANGASWSDLGTIAFAPTNNSVLLQVPDAGGPSQPLTRFEKGEFSDRWPDFLPGGKALLFGRRVAVIIDEQDTQLWLYDFSDETLKRLTFEGNLNSNPAWAPDGKRIAFQSGPEGSLNLFWRLADGSGGLERLTNSENLQSPNSWSSDGQLLAFIEVNPATGYDIWVLRLSDRTAQPFLQTRFNESAPRFSPDSHLLAYVSDESGRYEVYVQPYPGPGGKWQISTEGGTEPVWNRNGRELFFRSGDKMMAVDIATQPRFSAGRPRVLFEGPYIPTPYTFPNYDVSPDGQRFLMLKPSDQGAPTQIIVVLNWFEDLKRRVPTARK
jgi:serine/threonine protein kinase/Tol biopolymer transport system component